MLAISYLVLQACISFLRCFRQRRLSGALVLDIQSHYKYSYKQSPYIFQVAQGIALYPPQFEANQTEGGEPQGVPQLH